MAGMTSDAPPAVFLTFSPAGGGGGKPVAVFTDGHGDIQARAAAAGAALSVFVTGQDDLNVHLELFTPQGRRGSSDSGALAALAFLQERGSLGDALSVHMGGEEFSAQWCTGEWSLLQGTATVHEVDADLSPLGLLARPAWVASAGRPNLVVQLPDLNALAAFRPDAEAISAVNRATGTTGLVLFTPGGAGRADVTLRCFGPLKGFLEDAASSNMFACLTGVLCAGAFLEAGVQIIRGAQVMPGRPAQLTAQFTPVPGGAEAVWVGGPVVRVGG